MTYKLNAFYNRLNKFYEHLQLKLNNRNVTNASFSWMKEYIRLRELLKQSWRELYPELSQMRNIPLPPHRPAYIDAPEPRVIGLEGYRAWYDNLRASRNQPQRPWQVYDPEEPIDM